MIMSRTPFRISLFGGGTDYPAWFQQAGGAVLGTAINKYCYISVRELPPFFEYRHRMVYSRIEMVKQASEIQHPAIRAVFSELDMEREPIGFEIHHDGDLPARSGLGSSSSFTVGLLNALRAYRGRMSTARYLADEAIRIEQQVIGEAVGSQDQIWAAFGGTNVITFNPDGTYAVTPIVITPDCRIALQSHMMLFFTGFSRIAAEVAKNKIANLAKRERQLIRIRGMVDDALGILQAEKVAIAEIGALLHEGWMLKRELAEGVTTGAIDDIYQAGLAAGAYGGKILGAGGGGFILFFVPPERQQSVREGLRNLVEVSFEIGSGGSRIVVYEPDGLHSV
jgi:D-glycero-alpha-D-manno-heptose-7-phosphate kinase